MEEAKKMRPREYIKIRGANEHNLKNINVDTVSYTHLTLPTTAYV